VAYDFGDTVTLGITVTDAAGALTNAATNVLTITLPDGTTTVPSTANPSTGQYTASYVANVASGHFLWRWPTTSPATSETGAFDVLDALPPMIVSLADAKRHLNIPASETSNDAELREFIEAVTRPIEAKVGPIVRRTVTTTIQPCYEQAVALPYFPVISLTSGAVVRDNSAVTVTSLVVETGGILRDKGFSPLPFEPWTLTYVVGRPIIPAEIRNATLNIIKDLWTSQRGSAGSVASRLGFLTSYQALDELKPDMQLLGFA
jgi:hypothetical protein